MKRKTALVNIEAPKDAIEKTLNDAVSFITNWPYVVRISSKKGITAEILLPRFIFKFGDIYSFTVITDSNSYIYDGTGKRSHLIVTIALREWQKYVSAEVELAYHGRGEFFLGKTLGLLVEGMAKSLKELAESYSPPKVAKSGEAALQVDFADPMSVANFLAKAKMVHSGLYMVPRQKLLDVVGEFREKVANSIIYVSGITSDGLSSFKLLMNGSQILALEYRGPDGTHIIKVGDETSARKALELLSGIEGVYMINVWVPVGGV
ncbi:hypothetical protein [Thermococcus sp.]